MAGRPKGSPNRSSLLLTEILNGYGLNVPEQLVKLLPELEPRDQARVLLDLMEYIYPKRKSIDIALEPLDAKLEKEVLDIKAKVLSLLPAIVEDDL
jgi:hypothetical protein